LGAVSLGEVGTAPSPPIGKEPVTPESSTTRNTRAINPPSIGQRLTSVTDVIVVKAWRDEIVEAMPGAIETASDSCLLWLCSSVGSIGTLMAHRFAQYAAAGPTTWMVDDIGRTFGIGESYGRVNHTFDRLERFGIIRCEGLSVSVRLWLPPLSERQRERLPAYLAAVYPG
jgi:hypothetical protein